VSGPDRLWERGFEGHERAQRRRLARLPLPVKLEWLERAQEMLRHLEASRRRAGRGPSRS
jgi:hypothetical protein